jgi:hypothetical protein
MKQWLNELFKSRSGVSSTRVIMFLSLFLSFILAMYGIINERDLTGVSMLCGTFLVPAFGNKAYAKRFEIKEGTNTDEKN